MDDNFLDNGAVLPHGLLSNDQRAMLEGYAKSYENYAMRVGVVIETYPVTDEQNRSKLTTEYDVVVIEQNKDKGTTTILYRNCMSSEGLGSIADYFERTLRKRKRKSKKGSASDLNDQNGAVVLLLCLDASSDKGIIVGALTHPNRKTNLKTDEAYLEGEYNGVNIKVETDGSTTLTFKGATDNDGKIVDSTQGPTTLKIEKDGSYQVGHKTITQRLDKSGKASLTADADISNVTKKNFTVEATENIDLKATKNFNLACNELVMAAEGSATLNCQKLSVNAKSDIVLKGSQFQVEAEALAKIKGSSIVLDGMVSLGGQGGQPVVLLSAMILGTGNLGIPVISNVISGFATKVTAQ